MRASDGKVFGCFRPRGADAGVVGLVPLSHEHALAAAQAFVRAHHPDFDTAPWLPLDSREETEEQVARARARYQRRRPVVRQFQVRPVGGTAVGGLGSTVCSGGRLWLRAELLRGLGARLLSEPGRLKVRAGSRCLDAAALGAQWRERGWWVPVRGAAQAFGWGLTWRARSREAVVNTSFGWAAFRSAALRQRIPER